MTDQTVPRSILDQLGGEYFVAMTGAGELVGSADSLTMKVSVSPKRVGDAHARRNTHYGVRRALKARFTLQQPT